MNTGKNNGAVSEAEHLAAESLLGNAIKGDPHAAAALLEIPEGAWPDATMRSVAATILKLTADGAALELPLLLASLTQSEVSTSRVSDLVAAPHTCQPEKLAELLRSEYIDREQRRFHELRARGAISSEELRTCLADLNIETLGQQRPKREPVNTAGWLGQHPEHISFLFEGLIARKALVLLTGMGGIGKSGVLLVLIISGTIGRALFSSFKPTRRLRILWLCSEDDAGEVWRRWARVCDAFELTDEERETFTKNCRLFCVPGVPLMDANGKTTREYEWLKSELTTFGPDLVVLDPLCHFHELDENSNAEMALFVSRLRDLSAINGASILAVHHVPKARQSEAESAAARGASSIRDGARAMFSLVPLSDKECSDFGVSNRKIFAKLEHTKASWTALSDRPVWLKNSNGVWYEVDMLAQRDEVQGEVLSRLAHRIADLLEADRDETYTAAELYKKPRGASIRETLDLEFAKNATCARIKEAIVFGLNTGVLVSEELRTKGTTRQVLRKPRALVRTVEYGDRNEVVN